MSPEKYSQRYRVRAKRQVYSQLKLKIILEKWVLSHFCVSFFSLSSKVSRSRANPGQNFLFFSSLLGKGGGGRGLVFGSSPTLTKETLPRKLQPDPPPPSTSAAERKISFGRRRTHHHPLFSPPPQDKQERIPKCVFPHLPCFSAAKKLRGKGDFLPGLEKL